MSVTTKLRLRQSVGIVTTNNTVEFFKSNIRDNFSLKMNSSSILELLQKFDGHRSIFDIANLYPDLDIEQLKQLSEFLITRFVLIEHTQDYPDDLKENDYRLINLLEDYFHSTTDVINAVTKIKNSTAMIIGLGAVGSFLSLYLTKFGICSLVLVDNDVVEISNLHRQAFFEIDLGKSKAQQLRHQILEINPEANVKIIEKSLDESFFEQQELPEKLDLIINCADKPSVDFTSRIIATFAMKNLIPHIVGGGYNLHLTLIGQTIIPYQTACFNCFEKILEEINNAELENVKKLHRENRKLGSFSPLSGIAASMAAFDAFKVLVGAEQFIQQGNKRIEFKTKERQFNVLEIPKDSNCTWCSH